MESETAVYVGPTLIPLTMSLYSRSIWHQPLLCQSLCQHDACLCPVTREWWWVHTPSTHEGCGLWFMCLIMKVNHKYNKKHYRWTLFPLSVGISVRNHRITEPRASAALGDTAELQFSAAKALMSNEVWNCDETKPSLVPLLVKNLNVFILLAVF